MKALLRSIPSVNDVLLSPGGVELAQRYDRTRVVEAIRKAIADTRTAVLAERATDVSLDGVTRRAGADLARDTRPRLRRVINATGIVLHTNLGRAPVAEEAARAAYDAARGYLNLELDLDTGKRSSRQNPIREWLCRLTGAEAATAVNNNAAATVIALRALCSGKEAILSRGQLVEIGGSFRIPEIMAVSGAILKEVGTTNITRIGDYERALGPNVGALMRIHTSNYRVSGFVKSPSLAELVALGRARNVKVIDDIGSGAMVDFARFGLPGEPTARDSIRDGADLVLFSGDKLLGGPQAGILVGKKEYVQAVEKDPLMRAFRLDKMTLASLEASLRIYLDEQTVLERVPVLRLLNLANDELRRRAEALAERLRAAPGIAHAEACPDQAYVGGGSLPDQTLPTWVVAVVARETSDAELARRLRLGDPAVMGRVHDGRLLLDVRTIFPDETDALVAAVTLASTIEPKPA